MTTIFFKYTVAAWRDYPLTVSIRKAQLSTIYFTVCSQCFFSAVVHQYFIFYICLSNLPKFLNFFVLSLESLLFVTFSIILVMSPSILHKWAFERFPDMSRFQFSLLTVVCYFLSFNSWYFRVFLFSSSMCCGHSTLPCAHQLPVVFENGHMVDRRLLLYPSIA